MKCSVGWRTDNRRESRTISIMNRDRIEGIWKQLGGVLKQQWGVLTFDAAAVAAGKRHQYAGLALEQSGMAKEQSSNQIRDFLHRNRHWNLSTRRASNAKSASFFRRISCMLKLYLKKDPTPKFPLIGDTSPRFNIQPGRLLQIMRPRVGV